MNKRKSKNRKTKRKSKKHKQKYGLSTTLQAQIFALVSQNAIAETSDGQTFFIPSFCVNTAMHKDIVEIELLKHSPSKDRLKEACVVRIIGRKNAKFTGNIKVDSKGLYFKPDNIKLPQKMLVENLSDFNVKELDGKKVFASFSAWDDPQSFPYVKIERILGEAGEHDAEQEAILLSHNFERKFPAHVEEYAKKIKKEAESDFKDLKEREDFRFKPLFTIDPDDAKDFDDAISIWETENEIELGVHIADVSHYVKFNDPIDREAQKRGTSVYLVDKTIPMLPEILSNDLCSLNPNEDKRAFSVIFIFDKSFNLKKFRFAKTIIRSKKRFTYKEAQNILDSGVGEFYKELSIAKSIAQKERQKRQKSGAMDFESAELEFVLDKDGTPLKIYKKERLDTMKMIEDLMLLANRFVAEFLSKKIKDGFLPFSIYRIHDEPEPEKIQELASFLDILGVEFKHSMGRVSLKDISDMLDSIKGHRMQEAIEMATIRSMAKAIYSYKNVGHFSLGFKDYTHFTSPIRRYPDIMVHRILYSVLKNKPLSKEELEAYKNLAELASQREIEAMQAERDSIRIKQLEYMQKHKGEIFECIITGVGKNGFFLEEERILVSGFAPFALSKQYLIYDEKRHSAKTQDGREFKLADKIKARVKEISLEDKTLTWEILI